MIMHADMLGVHAVLLSGGGGTRLWPVSTETRPKQFLRLFGELSLFQLTLERVKDCGIDTIHVVTNAAYAHEVQAQAAERRIVVSLILEPMRRDSAPAIAAGMAALQAKDGPEAMAVVLPCDHLIPNHNAFAEALLDAVTAARSGYLVTFGIRPTSPSTEYGYICQGDAIPVAKDVFRAAAFREKPDLATAMSYLAGSDYHWNSGMFVFRVSDFAREAKLHMPQIWQVVQEAVGLGQKSQQSLRLHADTFARAEKISIDYALFEKSKAVALLPRQFAWSDVGNWSSVHAALPHDADGNAAGGDATLHESRNSLAFGDGVRVIALGVDNLVIIASPDGIFVAPKHRAAEIKTLL
jgi:mannose-1-phosphate guanylyltransferase/mannose-6-phosphate isomerase